MSAEGHNLSGVHSVSGGAISVEGHNLSGAQGAQCEWGIQCEWGGGHSE